MFFKGYNTYLEYLVNRPIDKKKILLKANKLLRQKKIIIVKIKSTKDRTIRTIDTVILFYFCILYGKPYLKCISFQSLFSITFFLLTFV